jgi:hypothetical protein
MAINIPILTEFSDSGIKAAKAAFNNFKTAVGDAEGGMNKFKAGSTAVMDSVKANAAAFAIAGAAAFVGFAKQSITAFQDLALEVDKFAIATGLSAEEASRWAEVTGDLGIEFGSVETAIGRMNRTIGQDPDIFKNLGVDLEYTNTGALDVNATFLNTIEHLKNIKDPAERAKEGVKLLGKGWTDMALLIDQGAGNLSASLASVSDAKVIDQNEISKARNFRDATNDLKDKFEDLAITIGEDLVPQITAIVTTLAPAIELPAKLVSGFAGLKTPTATLLDMGSSLEDVVKFLGATQVMADTSMTALELLAAVGNDAGDSMLYLTDQGRMYTEYTQSRINAINGTTDAIEDQGTEVTNTDLKWQALKGTLELDSAMADAKEQLDKLAEKAIEAFNGAEGALSEYEQGLIDAKLMVLELAETITLTDSQKNQIRVLVDTGELERALGLIDIISAGGYTPELNAMRFRGARAAGGLVAPGGSYLVGERGPELFTPTSSGNITPNNAMGGGSTITVNVNGGDPDAVVRAIQKYARQNGAIPLQTTTSARF